MASIESGNAIRILPEKDKDQAPSSLLAAA
jgi:hypothetical protein